MITKDELTADIAAGILAYSNMGFGAPEEDKVRWLINDNKYRRFKGMKDTTAESAITHLAGHLIESDEHQEAFEAEANAWAQSDDDELINLALNVLTREQIRKW